MRRSMFVTPMLMLGLANLYLAPPSLAQSEDPTVAMIASADASSGSPPQAGPNTAQVKSASSTSNEGHSRLSRIGIGINTSILLGPGAEAAYELTKRMNIRGGFNYFHYTVNSTSKGVTYGGTLKLESGDVLLDYFLWRSLHVSPGLLISNGSLLNATLTVPAGKTFTLSGTTYESSPTLPVAGTGTLGFNTAAPEILFGFGNLVPRGKHRFSMKFEIGGAFRGSPSTVLNFTGSVCDQTGKNCQPISSDTAFQNSVTAQQNKFNNDLSFLKFYPIISIGFGFRL